MIDWKRTGNDTNIEQAIRRLDSLHSYASTLKCRIMPGSRIAVYERHLKRFLIPAYDPRNDPDFNPAILAHGNRDVFELNFICEKLFGNHPTELRSAMPTLLSGVPLPEDDGPNQMPRNLQFQFLLAAQLAHSGYTVTLDEPDAVFVHEETTFGIAAKRPISKQQVVRRVREGVKQLSKSGLYGFIALSLDRLMKFPRPYLFAKTPAALEEASETLIQEEFSPFARKIQKAIAKTNITGIIVSLALVGCVRVPWQVAYTSYSLWLPREDDLPKEEKIIKAVLEALKGPNFF